jgi:hypothetical protein
MTSYTHPRESKRDQQDHIERHVWGEQKYIKGAGSIIKVRGTDTKDEETAVTVVGSGTSFNLKKDHNTEVFMLAGGADTTLKLAMLTIPRDKQRKWKEEHGGVQNPLDNEWSLDFGPELAHVTKKPWAVGKDGEHEITKEKNQYIRLDGEKELIVDGKQYINKILYVPQVVSGTKKPPNFKGNEEAEASDDDSGGGGGAGTATASVPAVIAETEEIAPEAEPADPRGVLIGDYSSPIAASLMGHLQLLPRSDLLLGEESKVHFHAGSVAVFHRGAACEFAELPTVAGKPLLEERLAALEARLAALEGRK